MTARAEGDGVRYRPRYSPGHREWVVYDRGGTPVHACKTRADADAWIRRVEADRSARQARLWEES